MKTPKHNIAFIDSQNLHLGTKAAGWKIDFLRFRVYLRDKFHVEEAYIFLWCIDEDQGSLYKNLQKAGYIVMFREHTAHMQWQKKGNVEVDIVFEMLQRMLENDDFDKIVLVSGDGDYIKPVRYLIKKWKFEKILFPNSQYSSLYNPIAYDFWVTLGLPHVKEKIKYQKK